MPRMIDMIRQAAVPATLMRAAARGALSLPESETIEILVYLANHPLFGEQARLTLAGWDIGGGAAGSEVASMHNVAWVCACWTLAAGVVVIVVRYWLYEDRWFILTGAVLLHVALHGLAGVPYLLAGLIAVAVAAVVIAISRMTRSRADSRGAR